MRPRVVPAVGDTQQAAHPEHRVFCLVGSHESEDLDGIDSVSRANQAALLPESPAPHATDGSPVSGGATPRAPRSTGHQLGGSPRSHRSARPSYGSPAPTAQTLATTPRECDRIAPTPPSVSGTQDCTGDGSSASGTPIIPKDKVSTKPGQLQSATPDSSASHRRNSPPASPAQTNSPQDRK